jgi:TusE/DsrC/DsvC family sulfur relay protein
MNDFSRPDQKRGDSQQSLRIIAGREIFVDNEGFLWHFDDWTVEVAEALARECGIDRLSDDQWTVIRFLRDYFAYHGRAPLNRDLKAHLGIGLLELETMFPGGIRRGARRTAGLPNPKSCA